mmetsp:Transcript_31252/g.42329  ORF Transcript_31252/g.42329 Transcript_31252/m.42329 type:complete len:93 (-) Transcript_31252:59-337(-)
MLVLERIAMQFGMKKVMLTVFKCNAVAMSFYVEKMGYQVDDTSPSCFGEDCSYEILSKVLNGLNGGVASIAKGPRGAMAATDRQTYLGGKAQ